MGMIFSNVFQKWLNPFYYIVLASYLIPNHKRLQTFALVGTLLSLPGALLLTALLLRNRKTRPYMLGFLLWQLFLDNSPTKGTALVSKRLRKMAWWKYVSEYFPVRVLKTAELAPEKGPYIIGCFPHGIIPFSVFCNWFTNGTNMDEKFPGLEWRIALLKISTQIPFFAQLMKVLGAITTDRSSMENSLKSGKSVVIVPGGAEESLLSRPSELAIIIRNRKGFIKVAVDQGVPLVPVLAFGENLVYNQMQLTPGGVGDNFIRKFKEWTRFVVPLISGRGIFQKFFGVLPHRREIVMVIGNPIFVERLQRNDPSFDSMVNYYHKEFMLQLERLYALHRSDKDWRLTMSLEEIKEEAERKSLVRHDPEIRKKNPQYILSKL